MTDATIFNGEGSTNPEASKPAATTASDMFTALVGEQQKYKTPEDLAKAYASADQFIEQLKEENRKLREQTAQAKTIDEVLERMSQQDRKPVEDTPPPQGLDPNAVQQLVEKTLRERQVQDSRTQNLLKADRLMKDKFGDKAEQIFKQRAGSEAKQKLLMELAATDPDDFVSMFAGAPVVTNNMDSSSFNTTSVASVPGDRSSVEGTKEWAAKVRKDDPTRYWSQEFQYKLQQTVSKNPNLYFGN